MEKLAEGYIQQNTFKHAGINLPANCTLGDITYHKTVTDEHGREMIQLTVKERFRNNNRYRFKLKHWR